MKKNIVVFLTMFLCGCSFSVPKSDFYIELVNPTPDKALVYFIRPMEYGSVRGTLIQVENDFAGIIAVNTFCYRFLEAGWHKVITYQINGDPVHAMGILFGDIHNIEVKANQTYYFIIDEISASSSVSLKTLSKDKGVEANQTHYLIMGKVRWSGGISLQALAKDDAREKTNKFHLSGYSNHADEWAYFEAPLKIL